jgi:hypothetical protein
MVSANAAEDMSLQATALRRAGGAADVSRLPNLYDMFHQFETPESGKGI